MPWIGAGGKTTAGDASKRGWVPLQQGGFGVQSARVAPVMGAEADEEAIVKTHRPLIAGILFGCAAWAVWNGRDSAPLPGILRESSPASQGRHGTVLPDAIRAPKTTPTRESVRDELRARVAMGVAGGFLSDGEIVEEAVDFFAGDADVAWLRRQAEHVTAEASRAHEAAGADWPSITDCDRLDRAFSELDAQGILARQNVSCCGSCGAGEMHDALEAAVAAGGNAQGYVFFDEQNTYSAVEGDGLFLSYGAKADDEASALAVGGTVVEVLRAHGLSTQWDGTWHDSIHVKLEWKRRRRP